MQLIRLRMGSMGLLRMRSCQGALLRASRALRPTMGSPIMKISSQRFYSAYNMNGSHLGRMNRHYSALQLLSLRHFSQTAGRLDATKNSGNNNNNNSNKNKNNKNKQEPSNPFEGWQKWVLPTLLLVLVLNGIGLSAINSGSQMTFQDFKANYLEKGLVKKVVVINGSYAQAELISGMPRFVTFTIGSPDFFDREMESIQDRLGIPNNERIPISYETRTSAWSWFVPFLPTILLIGGAYYLVMQMKKRNPRGTGGPLDSIMNVGKSKARLFNQDTDIKVKFKDVAGCDEAKAEIMEFVSFLKNPQKYEKLGAKIPRGAILSGPPGTGKTLLAKATAGEAGVPFLSVSGSEFVEMFVGVGASRVRDLFATARKLAPSIIFIDEIDAIGGAREKSAMRSNDEKEATLNQLLVEMDGFDTSDHVVVLAGTNRPDMLDKALLRPGRFDRHIYLDKPDIEGRKAIYKVHLRPLKLKEPVTDMFAGRLAAMTPGFSGADIANCCNEAALTAARHNADYVEMRDFEEAIERIIVGMERKTRVLTPVEKKTVAYHEAGHAICGWYLQYADPLLKVSIIPRGQAALGYAQYLPPDVYLISEEQFEHKMIMALGGRVSEELHFPDVTTGAADDLQKATKMANAMVLKLGMSKKLGTIIFEPKNNQMQIHKPFSEETFEEIDSEVHRLITECYKKCRKLLTEKIDDVDKVAKELLKKEVITRDDMIRLLGPRPFKEQNEAFKKYLMPAKEQQEQDHKGNENPQPASS